jgi:NADPH-dependent curcumin reductase CurA
VSREVVLAARPQGEPKKSDFEVRDAAPGEPGDGEVRVRNVFVSVDPYMRGRMSGIRTYVDPYEVGDVIDGGAVGRVVTSRHTAFAEGDWVSSMLGWREEGVVPGDALRKLDPNVAPPSTALGVLGMPGFTAWVGLTEIGRVEEGETLYVSGAAGAVGSVAVQIAKLKGLHVIGSAGSDEKVEWLRTLGVDAFDYRTTSMKDALDGGIDVYFDNVGGSQLEAALFALRDFGRVIACGAISRYNDERP